MIALISQQSAWAIVVVIALVTVLTCLHAIALALGREIAVHDLKVEARKRRHTAAAEKAQAIKEDEIITV